jgi:hypothetical protein
MHRVTAVVTVESAGPAKFDPQSAVQACTFFLGKFSGFF